MSAGFGQLAESRKARKNAQRQADSMDAKERERQSAIDSNIRKLRSSYGISDDSSEDLLDKLKGVRESRANTSPTWTFSNRSWGKTRNWTGDNPNYVNLDNNMRDLNERTADAFEAEGNKKSLDNYLDDFENSSNEIGTQAVQDQYGDAKLQQRRNLARRGLTGGSVDLQGRRTQLEQYVAGRQASLAGARVERQKLQSNMNRERQNMEGQIAAGNQVNPNFREIEGDIRAGLDTAKSSIAPTVAGNLFSVAGNTLAEDQIARGRGRRGLTGNSTPSASGTITG